MLKIFQNYLYCSRSEIGFIHGLIICIASVCSAYLTMMLFSSIMFGDYIYKVLPSILITPILISIFAIWFLFSTSALVFYKKFFIFSFIIILLITISIKAF